MTLIPGISFPTNHQEPASHQSSARCQPITVYYEALPSGGLRSFAGLSPSSHRHNGGDSPW